MAMNQVNPMLSSAKSTPITRIGTTRTHNQIIQAIAVDIACAGD
jgi:hypothetical protein